MFFGVKELERKKAAFDTSLAPGNIEFLDEKIRLTAPLSVRGGAELLSALQEIRVFGHLAGCVECDCDRCLTPMLLPVDGDFDMSYRPSRLEPKEAEVALDDEEIEVGFYEGGGVDLADVVREQVLLSLPMQRLCRPECKGICPACGQDRNEKECACRSERVDERWSALRDLRY